MKQKTIPKKEDTPKQRRGYPQIKKWLPFGSQKKIAKKLNVSNAMVSAVVQGRSFQPEIFKELLTIATAAKKRHEELLSQEKEMLQYLEESLEES
jgi:transcriptional regulator with XRE-family HTH domain